MLEKQWFETWFNSPYYHLLYQNRNEEEAQNFIEKLAGFLNLPKNSKLLDLACGKGRHAAHLSYLGYNVTGADLSVESIKCAKEMSSENLQFVVHDMREVIEEDKYDAIFNLFTSFGYFDDTSDNLKVLNSIHKMLHNNGLLVIDFMNTNKVIQNLIPEDHKVLNGVHFDIKRKFDGKHIIKTIAIKDKDFEKEFAERVQSLNSEDFKALLNKSDFKILQIFGSYQLELFDKDQSDRLIIIAQKK